MITPKLSLDFTTASLDPRVTVTRTTGASNPATYVGSNGLITAATNNQPRFDYNPVTLVCNGLLIEEQRTNLLLRSEQFDNVLWQKGGVTLTANSVIAPDGTLTADTFNATSGLNAILNAVPVTVASGTAYTFSFYALRGTAPVLTYSVRDATNSVNIIASVNYYNQTSSSTWARISVTFTTPATCTSVQVYPLRDSLATGTFSLWGAQLEAGSFATSYIPTINAALTRNADVAVITGSNFTSFWNSVQGGTSVQATPSTVSGIRPLVQFDDGTANEIIALRGNTTNPELYIVDGGTPQAQLDAGTISANTAYSLTGWWATNDCKARQDSGPVVTDTTATIPTVTQMRIGSDGTNYLNGTIATIGYYDSFFGRPIYTRRKNKVFPSLF
jgi:hypothetical protein